MTDTASHDIASTSTRQKTTTGRKSAEFVIYFTIIFFLALPFSTVGWIVEVIRRQTLMLHGPLARAWAEADRITPLIFSA